MRTLSLTLWLGLFVLVSGSARASFVVSDIRVEGLQRISPNSVFTALPVNVGDTATDEAIADAIRSLFYTGNFDDIAIAQDGSVLVVNVVERPSINEINIEGNKAIETEQLLKGLKGAGLAEGNVFRRSTLENMKQELMRQYVGQGRYDASVDTEVVSLPRNRVTVNIDIDEGNTAKIKYINIVGNQAFSTDDLRDLLEINTTGFWSWLTGDDKYSKEKLSGGLETLNTFYLDRGYIKFSIESAQVSVTPQKDAVYITVALREGDIYSVDKVNLSGDLVVDEDELRKYIEINTGDTFSQTVITRTEEAIKTRLGNDGYNFAEVQTIPEVNDETKTVDLKFFIDPGKRTYVRRISFSGNTQTSDEVLRREMRQMESAPALSSAIEQSRVRLERLGYFKEAKVDTEEISGTDDMIDLKYTVEEQPSGSIGASVGYSQDSGFLFGVNVQQDNFLGSGRSIGVGLNKSDYQTSINFNYLNPYYTEDGVSRGFSVYYRESNYEELNISSYNTNTLGAQVNFGYPLSETQRLDFGLGWSNTEIEVGTFPVQEISATPVLLEPGSRNLRQYFIPTYDPVTRTYLGDETASLTPIYDSNGNFNGVIDLNEGPGSGFLDIHGNKFNNYTLTTSWVESTLNRGRLATRGAQQTVSLEVAVPGSDLEYYKLIYRGQIFVPVIGDWTLRFRTQLGYGDGYGNTDGLPFFENFYGGGFGSVRGFKSNTLGPRSTPADIYRFRAPVDGSGTPQDFLAYEADPTGSFLTKRVSSNDPDPFGGNVLVEGSVELLFPLPFIKDRRSLRSAFFVDAGNVFSSNCGTTQINCFAVTASELRYSFGVGVTWITGFGPLTFSLAKPLNEAKYDEREVFQFSLGRSF